MTSPVSFTVKRDVYNQSDFDELYRHDKSTHSTSRIAKKYLYSLRNVKYGRLAKQCIPIIEWLPKYDKSFFVNDVVAGITIAIFNVPQAMAYAALAGVPPIVGLYSSFFAPILYAIFGTSNYVSLGMFSIVALMVGSANEKYSAYTNFTGNDDFSAEDLSELSSVQIASAMTLTIGLILAVMLLLQFHFIFDYMSDQLVGGYTTAAACHLFVTQLPKIFGLKISTHQGFFKIFSMLKDFIISLPSTNIPDLVVSVICFAFVHIGKWHINPVVLQRSPVPVPFELIAVIVATVISYFVRANERFGIEIISVIPTGFPTPRAPNFSLISVVLVDSILTSIVVFSITISLCKIFQKKNAQRVNGRQELRSLVIAELVISFFSCHPACGSLTRTTINVQCGAQTQVSSIVSAALLAFVIMWIAPLLTSLPKCVLAAIIVVALQTMIVQVRDTPKLWRTSKIDFAIWMVSFFGTIVWDVSQGLGIAIAFALFTVIVRTQWPNSTDLVQIKETELYREAFHYPRSQEVNISDTVIVRFDAPLLFLNCEKFKEHVNRLIRKHDSQLHFVKGISNGKHARESFPPAVVNKRVQYVIIDASAFTSIDLMGVTSVVDLAKEMKLRDIRLHIAACRAHVLEQCERCNIYDSIPKTSFFPSVHDAILSISQKNDSTLSTSSCCDSPS